MLMSMVLPPGETREGRYGEELHQQGAEGLLLG